MPPARLLPPPRLPPPNELLLLLPPERPPKLLPEEREGCEEDGENVRLGWLLARPPNEGEL